MATLDTLPADQRAVLQLVLQRGRSYDEIAAMLSIDRAAVRERALAALDALGPPTSTSAPQRALLTDYLLGQLPSRIAEQTRERLATSSADRAWARVVSAEIGTLSPGPLPEIPPPRPGPPAQDEAPVETGYGLWSAQPAAPPEDRAEAPAEPWEAEPWEPEPAQGQPEPGPAEPEPAADEPATQPGARAAEAVPAAGAQREPPRFPAYGAQPPPRSSSRRGGAILLGLLAVVVVAVVVVIIATSGGSNSPKHNSTASKTTATGQTSSSSSTTTTTPQAQLVAELKLASPDASDKTVDGEAQVIRQGTQTGIVIVARGLQPNTKRNAYAVWLYRSASDSLFLGFVGKRVTKSGQMETEGVLPAAATRYRTVLVTLETGTHPKTPGQVVLQGTSTKPF